MKFLLGQDVSDGVFETDQQQRRQHYGSRRNSNALFSEWRTAGVSESFAHILVMNKCEELQFDLPLYTDGSLDVEVRSAIDAHLPECPLCRQKLSEFHELATGLKAVPRYAAPRSIVDTVRTRVSMELRPAGVSSPTFALIDRRRRWTDIWLMPMSAASMATLVLGFTLLFLVVNSEPAPLTASPSRTLTHTPLILSTVDLTPDEYAYARKAISGESPSINPRGALVALTKSFVRGEMRDDEVTVVADVFGNGVAQIAEVVEPSHDRHAVEELQRALASDPAFAPFVPARLDRRSDSVRVILKIQNVNVRTGMASQ